MVLQATEQNYGFLNHNNLMRMQRNLPKKCGASDKGNEIHRPERRREKDDKSLFALQELRSPSYALRKPKSEDMETESSQTNDKFHQHSRIIEIHSKLSIISSILGVIQPHLQHAHNVT